PAACNIEEMLQIDSPTINSCEFFHGPFEVLDAKKPVFLLLSAGRCRPADERPCASSGATAARTSTCWTVWT
ncbi:MAG: hypothetical protein LKK35_01445, partial [Olsenella sp.]|nr:hypothetical protein [Olsenella sp.]